MEYSVGSLADLISGNDTPNKPKVVQKGFTPVRKKIVVAEPVEKGVDTKFIRPKVKSKKKKDKISNIKIEESSIETNEKPKTKRKKRKSDIDVADNDGEETTPKMLKLSKNEQNAANRIKNKINQENKNSSEYKDRTVFVGNIPINIKKENIKKHFRKYGVIDSVRIRGIPVADPKTSKKVAAITKEFHPDRNTIYAFIRFVNEEDAKKAEAENGELFLDHHLRVHCCESDEKPDESKAIFIGNVKFDAEEEELWNLFKPCGPISHVRIVRDGRTGMGKGFGYVNFKDADSVQLALEMENVMLKERELRISLCDSSRANKKKKAGKNEPRFKPKKPRSRAENGSPEEKKAPREKKNFQFSGTKFTDKKKKNKFSKATSDKKKLAKKLTAA